MYILFNNKEVNETRTQERLEAIQAFYDRGSVVTVLLYIYGMIGLIGNILIVMVYWRMKKLSSTDFLIFLIAILDGFVAAFLVPMNIVFNQYWMEINSESFCKVLWTMNIAFVSPEFYLLFGVSLVRYVHVCRFTYMYLVNNYFLKPFLVFVFAYTAFVSMLCAYVIGKQKWHPNEGLPGFYCNLSDEYRSGLLGRFFITFYTGSYLICLLGILAMNIMILLRIIRQRKVMASYKPKHKGIPPKHNSHFTSFIFNSKEGGSSTYQESHGQESQLTSELTYEEPSTVLSPHDNFSLLEQLSVIGSTLFGSTNGTRGVKRKSLSSTGSKATTSLSSGSRKSKAFNDISIDFDLKSNDKVKIPVKKRRRHRKKMATEPDKICSEKEDGRCCRHTTCIRFEGVNRTTLKLTIVSFLYIICYLPFYVVTAYVNYGERKSRKSLHNEYKYLINPSLYAPLIGCALNPVIYTLVDPKFRRQVKQLFVK